MLLYDGVHVFIQVTCTGTVKLRWIMFQRKVQNYSSILQLTPHRTNTIFYSTFYLLTSQIRLLAIKSQSLLPQSASCSRHQKTWSCGDQSRPHVQIIGWQRVIVLHTSPTRSSFAENKLYVRISNTMIADFPKVIHNH